MFLCPLCSAAYADRMAAEWCRRECEAADREARR